MKGLLLSLALMATVVVYAVFDTDSGIRTLWQVRANLAASEGRIALIKSENARLQRQAAGLANDAFAVESAIREDLALVRPGERVVRLSGTDDSNPRFP